MNQFLLVFLLFSCTICAQKIDKKAFYSYSKNINFRVMNITKNRTTTRGPLTVIAENGRRFITLSLEFKNNSSQTQNIDFTNSFLIDEDLKLYEIEHVLKAMKLSGNLKQFEQEIKPNKNIKVMIEFNHTLPKDEVIKTLQINDNIIDLLYN